ncbi:MAG: nucleotidyl transferase AbiEii/AbiGii toxin family protein [Polyangiaceae bacterium]|nr:nucleotidyl transferase AbiEii/AbiGii toxin family protein [Polyangiaceae bacterium]
MATDKADDVVLRELAAAGIEFVVVGGTAAVLQGAPVFTEDLDIVHRRTPENVERLLAWLVARGAYHRYDLSNRKLPPTREQLLGTGQLNFETTLGKIDTLCELGPGEGYEQILGDAIDIGGIPVLGLERLIAVKARANRPKDRATLPVLIATLDERSRRSR